MTASPLPAGWEQVPLEELISEGPTNGTSPKSGGDARGATTLRLSATTSGRMILTPSTTKRVYEEFDPDSRYWLEPGDLLVQRANTLEYVGTAAVFDGPPQTYIYPDMMMRIRLRSPISTAYVWRFLNSNMAKSHFRANATGTAGNMPKVHGKTVRATPVRLPPLNEQRRIVEKIDALEAHSRRAKEALEAIPPLLERFRQSVLAAAFRGDLTADWRAQHPDVEPADQLLERIRVERRRRWEEDYLEELRAKGKVPKNDKWKAKYKPAPSLDWPGLPELPASWAWVTLDTLVKPGADICYGIVQPGKEVPGGIPYVRGKDIQDGVILEHQLRRTSPEIAAKYSRASLAGGDVLLGIIRATKVAIVTAALEGANITQGTVRLRPGNAVLTPYLASFLDSAWAQSSLHSMYRGIDMPGLNVRDVRRLPVAVAPLAEQRAIGRVLAALLERHGVLSDAAVAARLAHGTLDASILAKAFRGELVPQDPDDEPASVLLARIRAEASARPTKKTDQRRRKAKASEA